MLDGLSSNLRIAADATDKMRARATTVFAASAGLTSFVTAAEFIKGGNEWQTSFVCASVLAGAFVAFKSIGLYMPRDRKTPGCSANAQNIRDLYLNVEEGMALMQIVSDRAACFADSKILNLEMARLTRQMDVGFLMQVLCVAGAVMCRLLFKG